MANNLPGQIISELGQIAKDVGKQTAQVPKDIAGKALESLGSTSGKGQQAGAKKVFVGASQPGGEQLAWDKLDSEKDQQAKKAMARKALEELVGQKVVRKREPSIWERLQQEELEKKQVAAQQTAASRMSQPIATPSKRPRGDLYGTKAKKLGSEVGKNVRQD